MSVAKDLELLTLCVYFLSTRITGMTHHARLFQASNQNQQFTHANQAHHLLSYIPSSREDFSDEAGEVQESQSLAQGHLEAKF